MAFCDELKRLRKEKNVSQQTLANNIYVSRSAIAKWENGLGLPSEENIDQLVSYFNVPRENFFPKIEDQELVEKNKTIRKKFKIISTICYFFTLAVIAIFVTYLVIGLNNTYIFNSDKVIAVDGYYVFLEEYKHMVYSEESDSGFKVYQINGNSSNIPDDIDQSKFQFELDEIDNITITKRWLFFSGLEKIECQKLYLGWIDEEGKLLYSGTLYMIKDDNNMFHYFLGYHRGGIYYFTGAFSSKRYFSINDLAVEQESDYYFKSSIDLSLDSIQFKLNGYSVKIFTEYPEYKKVYSWTR